MNISRIFKIRLLFLLAVLIAVPLVHAQELARLKLLIHPFAINAPGSLSYLQEGVRTMLASRVAARTGAILVDSEAEADLILTGSITGMGESVSLDASLIRVASGRPENFFASASDQSGIIAAVDRLSAEIGASISGEPRKETRQEADEIPTLSEPAVSSSDKSLDQTGHPDRMFLAPSPNTPPVQTVSQPVVGVPAFTTVKPAGVANRSQFLDLEIQVMDVGDVFGEGSNQVVLAEKQRITVFRQNGERLDMGAEVPAAPRHVRIVSLCLADLNGNGRAEIYVSTIAGNKPLAYAVEWDGAKFIKLFDRQSWYVRSMVLPGRGLVLLGQRGGLNSPVKPGIFVVKLQDEQLSPGEDLALPKGINLFDFTMADFTGDGRIELVSVDQDGILSLYTDQGALLWRSNDQYNYTIRYIGPSVSSQDSGQVNFKVPLRLSPVDLNGDGRQELVVMKNPVDLQAIIRTIGNFTGSKIEVLAWNGIGFDQLWSTGEIGSYVATAQVTSSDKRLYIGLVNRSKGLLLSSLQSTVASYGLANLPQ